MIWITTSDFGKQSIPLTPQKMDFPPVFYLLFSDLTEYLKITRLKINARECQKADIRTARANFPTDTHPL